MIHDPQVSHLRKGGSVKLQAVAALLERPRLRLMDSMQELLHLVSAQQ